MRAGVSWVVAAAAVVLVVAAGAGIRLVAAADPAQRARVREAAAAVAQYGLLFGFAAVAAAVSAHGLVGFARSNMGLPGLWPYLLWGALDGAAGLCAVLLMRCAARGESALAPRLAVWGLVAASSAFNWTHAPDHPGARAAFALMPVIAAVLFEFSLRETRHTARSSQRRLTALGWLRPAERIRVQMLLSVDQALSAEAAARRVRVEGAARRLHALRHALAVQEQAARPAAVAAHRVRRAERRAQAALARARFTDPVAAAEVLRQVQVLTLTPALARLDYSTAEHAHAVIAGMIGSGPGSDPANSGTAGHAACPSRPGSVPGNGTPDGYPAMPGLNGASLAPAPRAAAGGLDSGVSNGAGYAAFGAPCPAAGSPPGSPAGASPTSCSSPRSGPARAPSPDTRPGRPADGKSARASQGSRSSPSPAHRPAVPHQPQRPAPRTGQGTAPVRRGAPIYGTSPRPTGLPSTRPCRYRTGQRRQGSGTR